MSSMSSPFRLCYLASLFFSASLESGMVSSSESDSEPDAAKVIAVNAVAVTGTIAVVATIVVFVGAVFIAAAKFTAAANLAIFAMVASTFFFFLDKTAAVAVSVTIDESTFLFLRDGVFPVLHLNEQCCFIFLFLRALYFGC